MESSDVSRAPQALNPPYIIGIAGPAGAGKTSLARSLAQALGDASVIHIDAYQRVTQQPLGQVAEWMARGGDFDEFPIPVLPDHLRKLKQGESVHDPVSLQQIAARKYIVFETHFGRAHSATGQFIDYLVWIDTPLDVALARNIRDLIRPVLDDPRAVVDRNRLAWLDDYVAGYLQHVRALVQMQQARVGSDADLVVDGSLEAQALLEHVRDHVLARLP